ncbi:MAG: undecaprenyl/decaprenyl-phosphate alpha-N-acetylglucosaminyl 1-phosphate transferase [Saprospiraceae bacterium]|nr:undecaprenyl/decaprenyl-phosphate alpha-N-acetylglucosaminyl 1-phosphate transferase [Saprospiraceae bacterium]
MYDIILSFITAFTLTYLAIPSIIYIARVKHLVDEPGERRSHKVSTPSLGGIGIFAGIIFSTILWTPFEIFGNLQYMLCALIFIFLIGAKDDIVPMLPTKKLLGQLIAAMILVFKADVRLLSFHGVFEIYNLSYGVSAALSVFLIIVVINAFNLIDGINGLSGSIGTLICLFLGTWFIMAEQTVLALISFTTAGAVMAFLSYNFRAEIFMGDTGAMIIGMICSVLTIKFLELSAVLAIDSPLKFTAVPAIALGLLILPLFDTLRVFVTRIFRGRSPLYPDRSHIHHLLIDSGLSHVQATLTLVFVNVIFLFLIYELQGLGTIPLILLTLGLAALLSGGLYQKVRRMKRLHNKPVQSDT